MFNTSVKLQFCFDNLAGGEAGGVSPKGLKPCSVISFGTVISQGTQR